jgi:hypothetical protein
MASGVEVEQKSDTANSLSGSKAPLMSEGEEGLAAFSDVLGRLLDNGWTDGSTQGSHHFLMAELTAFYQEHCPEKLEKANFVADVLKKYPGEKKGVLLMAFLRQKYEVAVPAVPHKSAASVLGSLQHLPLSVRTDVFRHLFVKFQEEDFALVHSALLDCENRSAGNTVINTCEEIAMESTVETQLAQLYGIKERMAEFARAYLFHRRKNQRPQLQHERRRVADAKKKASKLVRELSANGLPGVTIFEASPTECIRKGTSPSEHQQPSNSQQAIQISGNPDMLLGGACSIHHIESIIGLEYGTTLRSLLPSEYELDQDAVRKQCPAGAPKGAKARTVALHVQKGHPLGAPVTIIYGGVSHVACSPTTLLQVWKYVADKETYLPHKEMAERILRKETEDGDHNLGPTDRSFVTLIRAEQRLGYHHGGELYLCALCAARKNEELKKKCQ